MDEIKEICISRLDKMGDMILSLPAIKAIKVTNPNIKICVLASKHNARLLKGLNYVDRINVIDKKNNIFTIYKNLFKIRKLKFDCFLNFSPTFLSYFFCFFSNAKKNGTLIFLSRYKNSIFSQLFTRLFSKLFCTHIYIVNRYLKLNNNLDLHQTNMIFKLLEICKIPYTKNVDTEIMLPNEKFDIFNKNKKLITIHLNNKWINNYFHEIHFLQLLNRLPKEKYQYVLTTDNSSAKKFKQIFTMFNVIENTDLISQKKIAKNITILNKLNYQNWLKIIYSSYLCITPECGCSHISAACKVPVMIIYDADNLPGAIQKEYHPWKNPLERKYDMKLFSNDKKLIEKILVYLADSIKY